MDRKENQRGRSHRAFRNWETHEVIHRQHNRRKQKIISSFPHINICAVFLKILGTSPNTARGAKLSIEDICVEQTLLTLILKQHFPCQYFDMVSYLICFFLTSHQLAFPTNGWLTTIPFTHGSRPPYWLSPDFRLLLRHGPSQLSPSNLSLGFAWQNHQPDTADPRSFPSWMARPRKNLQC